MSDLLATMPIADLIQSSSSTIEDSKDEILKKIQIELDKHRMREVLDLYKSLVVKDVYKNGSYIVWDLVPIICQRLRGLSEFRFKTFNCCRQILLDLCEVCNPKELLIIYLSELENDLNIAKHAKRDASSSGNEDINDDDSVSEFEIVDSNCFKALIKPFECILLKLPTKRNETLKSVLSSLNEHVSRLSLSSIKNYDFEKNDRYKFMIDPMVKNINSLLSMYVDFLETFVKEVDITNGKVQHQNYSKTSDPNIQRLILLKTLLRILDYPLKYMDLFDSVLEGKDEKCPNQPKESKSPIISNILDENLVTSKCIAVKVIKLISCLHSSFYTLLNRTDLITCEDIIVSNSEFSDIYLSSDNFNSAISVISFLLATEPELSPSNFIPRVYTHIYNLEVHLPYVQHLLENSQFLVYDKGLELLTALLEHIKEGSLEVKFLDLLRKIPVDKSLLSIMVFSRQKFRRRLALELFKNLVHCFEHLGRYKILYSILSRPRQHAGFQAIVISMYKDLLFSNSVYQGANLHRLIRSLINISLPYDVYSDLLDKNDLIFASINFFRYTYIRDQKLQNSTRIWDIQQLIKDSFIKPLYEALEISRAHYKLELCKLKEIKMNMNKKGDKRDKKSKKEPKVELTVLEGNGKTQVPTMSIEQEHSQIILALQNFDLLESVLARLKEVMEEQL